MIRVIPIRQKRFLPSPLKRKPWQQQEELVFQIMTINECAHLSLLSFNHSFALFFRSQSSIKWKIVPAVILNVASVTPRERYKCLLVIPLGALYRGTVFELQGCDVNFTGPEIVLVNSLRSKISGA